MPPTVTARANYPGASAQVIADTVATLIEQEVNGVDNMLYMSSQATDDGQLIITVTFGIGTDLDKAQMLVQNRVAIAENRLPEPVRRTGVTVRKDAPGSLLVVQILSPDDSRNQLYLSNYATSLVQDVLARLLGVGDVQVQGARDHSINTLTLFALVPAVGILVDDAIVVENVERFLAEGLTPKEAARRMMDEVGGALISIALVLASVFVPTMFLDGISAGSSGSSRSRSRSRRSSRHSTRSPRRPRSPACCCVPKSTGRACTRRAPPRSPPCSTA